MKTVYDRIDFLYQQCLQFVAARERKLYNDLEFERLYLSVDRQIYLVNWWHRKDKRNVPIYATGCADNHSRYVFAKHSMNLNNRTISKRIKEIVCCIYLLYH